MPEKPAGSLTRGSSKRWLKSFKAGFWVSFQYFVMWTDPWVFVLYSLVKPLAAFAIWVFMFLVARAVSPQVPTDRLLFIVVGGVIFYPMLDVVFGTIEILHMEREHYNVFKLIAVADVSLFPYVLGRVSLLYLKGLFSSAIALVLSRTFLKLPLSVGPSFWLSLTLTATGFVAIGIFVTGLFLFIEAVFDPWTMGGVLVGPVFVICGVVFPIGLLPPTLQKVAFFLPQTYWIELVRRTLTGVASINIPNARLLLLSLSTALPLFLLAWAFLEWSVRKAKARGTLEISRGV